jgi:hypothetical protein
MNKLLLLLILPLAGCASAVSQFSDGHPNRDHVPVPPGSRAVMMTGSYADADMDGWLELPRGAGAFRHNNGIIQGRDGDVLGYIEASPNGWLFGNLIYGGPIGVIADCIIGGAWDLQPYPKLSITWKDK